MDCLTLGSVAALTLGLVHANLLLNLQREKLGPICFVNARQKRDSALWLQRQTVYSCLVGYNDKQVTHLYSLVQPNPQSTRLKVSTMGWPRTRSSSLEARTERLGRSTSAWSWFTN